MKKIIIHILAGAAAALSLLSCVREPLLERPEGEGIVLDFLCVDPVTKAGTDGVKDGEDPWNENYIQTVDVFFYTSDGVENDCVLHERFTPDNASGRVSLTLYADDGRINTLVPGSANSFWVYAVANYPGTIVTDESNLSGTSVSHLKERELSCDFANAPGHKQSSFVMDGLAEVKSVDKSARLVAKGEVQLKRVAAKITVQLNIADQVKVDRVRVENDVEIPYQEIWEPMITAETSVQMYIENAVCNTTLAALPVDDPDYFSYKNNRMTFVKSTAAADADFPWKTDPTYVYPQRWEYASKVSPTVEPTIKLILPWKRLSDEVNGVTYTQKQFYYKIIIPEDAREADGDVTFLRNFVRNNWYNFKMDVGMLGSETDGEAILLEGTYFVMDWQDKDIVQKQASIGKARFLSIEPKEHTLYNENTLDMLYTSSHPVALNTTKGGTTLDITATKIYYGSNNAGTSYGGGTIRTAGSNHPDYPNGQKYIEYSAAQRKALNDGNDWVAVNGDYVTLTHMLNNDISANEYLDTAPYIIRFNLYHADHYNDALYKQPVKIIQYPAIYITNETSNGSVFLNGTNNTSLSNLNNLVDDADNIIGSIVAPTSINDSGDNTNPRLYTIHISVLPSDSEDLIGDPRTDGNSAVVTTLDGLNASANYRPAADNTQNILAPAVVIASSYGKTTSLWYENAQTRCAAYQENGYPAGRWRLPTSAELEYFVMLSEAGIIPSLFNPGMSSEPIQASNRQSYYYYSYYWSGGGYGFSGDGFDHLTELKRLDGTGSPNYTFNSQSYYSSNTLHGVNHHSGYTRCVYDVWYWGEETDKNHMTSWGGYQTTK